MKKVFMFMLVSLTLATVSCSKSDDNNVDPKVEGTVKERLVGKWNQSAKFDDAVYQYNSDGTVTFTNYYYNGKDVFNGAWRLLEGDVLHEVYADKPSEAIKVDWAQAGGKKWVVVQVDSKTLQLKDANGVHVKTLYRQK